MIELAIKASFREDAAGMSGLEQPLQAPKVKNSDEFHYQDAVSGALADLSTCCCWCNAPTKAALAEHMPRSWFSGEQLDEQVSSAVVWRLLSSWTGSAEELEIP